MFLAVPTLERAIFPTAKEFASTFGLKLTSRQEASYAQNWSSVVRSFLTPPATEAPIMIKTKGLPPDKLSLLFEKPLLCGIKRYFEQN